jgi:predicted RNase H-like HicB family nuclease
MSKGGSELPQADGVYTAWVIISPAEDVKGAWIAHALEFDVITQGDSAAHAFRMIAEAVALFLDDTLRRGGNPTARRAPPECWEPLLELFTHGEQVAQKAIVERISQADRSDTFAVQMIWLTGHKRAETDKLPPVAFTATATNAHPC